METGLTSQTSRMDLMIPRSSWITLLGTVVVDYLLFQFDHHHQANIPVIDYPNKI